MNAHRAMVPFPPADLHSRPLHSGSPGTQSCHGNFVFFPEDCMHACVVILQNQHFSDDHLDNDKTE